MRRSSPKLGILHQQTQHAFQVADIAMFKSKPGILDDLSIFRNIAG